MRLPSPGGAATAFPAGEFEKLFLLRLIACWTETSVDQLRSAERGNGSIVLARQMAIYLMHTALGICYREVAEWIGRDRTTVAHACRRVEMMRDCPSFDESLARLEALIEMLCDRSHCVGQTRY